MECLCVCVLSREGEVDGGGREEEGGGHRMQHAAQVSLCMPGGAECWLQVQGRVHDSAATYLQH
jgi:hypothetical protein